MFRRLADRIAPPLSGDLRHRIRANAHVNSAGFDPWGLHLDTAEETVRWARLLYDYFQVRTTGIERVPSGRVLIVPNHSGQLPVDGLLVGLAMLLEADPPRIVRGMVERWFPTLPYVSKLFTRCGQVVGDPANCRALLEDDQSIMVFPEGVRGSGKTIFKRYQLQRFGTGFVRLALECRAPIVPVAIIGAEETYPSIWDGRAIAKRLGMPYFPVTPFWPLLGPLGAIPLPVQIDLIFGEPIHLEGDPEEPDRLVYEKVGHVQRTMQAMIDSALDNRPDLQRLSSLPGVP